MLEICEPGGEQDVRWVVARLRAAGELTLDDMPWGRFSHAYGPADDVPAMLQALSDPDAGRAESGLKKLWSRARHQGNSDTTLALAVPFLLRIAAEPAVHNRHRLLRLAAEAGHRNHFGTDLRTDLFQVSDDPDELMIDGDGRPVVWTQQAAREAVTTDASLLIWLLDDPDVLVRANTAYALAGALSPPPKVQAALQARLATETYPTVRISLVLAIAQLAALHGDPDVVRLTRELWAGEGHAPDVRFAAALSWLCATAEPVPDRMLDLFVEVVGPELAEWMKDVPWPDRIAERGLVAWLVAFLGEAPTAQAWLTTRLAGSGV
ncbi:HEAT repeat domain-containing protein [Micromonospora sp. U56]|uniref:HEAT repeat domain-containing protein n=1 Tax=Micromonospora sp. U56 TaxID=2824900 RepID=UPI001B384812|nr:HEAT repeat domain-containing protein [Micromonospora sp. U56]MBQ0895100.1 HEAT repeat domain-containing protein [Micromonospora sp. U56]